MRSTLSLAAAGCLLLGTIALSARVSREVRRPRRPLAAGRALRRLQPDDRAAAAVARPFRRNSGRLAIPRSSPRARPSTASIAARVTAWTCGAATSAGPNLLRSQLALNDLEGELIGPVITQGRQNPGMPVMPPLPLAPDDIKAVAAHIHACRRRCAARDRRRRARRSRRTSSSATPRRARRTSRRIARSAIRPPGICRGSRARIADPVQLQNLWVGGGAGGGRGRGAAPAVRRAGPNRRQVTVVVTQPSGPEDRRAARPDRRLPRAADDGGRRAAVVRPQRRRAEGRGARSARGTSPAALGVHRSRHSQRDGLSGDPQMRLHSLVAAACLVGRRPVCSPGSRPCRSAGARSASDQEAARGFVADLLGRLHRPALQRLDAGEPDDGQEPHARVDGAPHRRHGSAGGGGGGVAGSAAVDSAAVRRRR